MGLFGYGKRDFDKNTKKFIGRLEYLSDSCLLQESNASELCKYCRTAIDKMIRMSYAYPENASKKDLKQVDERISYLIGLMERDVRDKNLVMFTMHTGFLHETLFMARRFGKEDKTPEQLKAEEIVAESLAQTREYLCKIIEVKGKQKALEEESDIYSDEDPRLSVIEQEYEKLEEELKLYRSYLAEAKDKYRVNQRKLDFAWEESEADKLTYDLSPREVDRLILRLCQKWEKMIIKDPPPGVRAPQELIKQIQREESPSLRSKLHGVDGVVDSQTSTAHDNTTNMETQSPK